MLSRVGVTDAVPMQAVEWLADHKADVNACDHEGQTPLHYGATCEHREVRLVVSLLAQPTRLCQTPNAVCRDRSVL